jgi:serine protease Do
MVFSSPHFKSRWTLALLLFGAIAVSLNAQPAPDELTADLRRAVDAAVSQVSPALVRLQVVSTQYFEGREVKYQSVGSGVIITPEGHLVTNHHVAGHAVRIICTLANREEIEADLIGSDPLTDIAVVQLKPSKPRTFQTARFGDSSRLRVGEHVLAMGSPMALSQSVTLGIVSNLEMIMPRFFGPSGRLRQDGEDVGSFVAWIGHDAQIYGGNSGGPLANLHGEIIGINEIRMGLGGAIPGNLARDVANALVRHGRVQRAWLGLEAQPLLKAAYSKRGVLVSSVLHDSPAHLAGLQSGDIIQQVGAIPVHAHHDEELPPFAVILSQLPVGQSVSLGVLRGDQTLNLDVVPREREELRPRQRELKPWGITARNLSWLGARELKRTDTKGVLVTSIRPGGPAGEAKPPLQQQDVIVQVNEARVDSLAQLMELTTSLTADGEERVPVLVTFERKDRRYLTVIRLGVQELIDPGLEATKGWLPIETEVISREIATQLGQPGLKGFYLTRVHPDSSADKASLRPGDFIVALDGETLTASAPEHSEELATLVRQYDPGTTATVTILRDGQRLDLPIEISRSPHLRREMRKYRNEDFEFTVRDVAFQDRVDEQWPVDQAGVMVDEVRSGSWAELGTLYIGDLIIEIAGQPVAGIDDTRAIMERAAAERQSFIVLKVLRGIHTRYLALEPKWTL